MRLPINEDRLEMRTELLRLVGGVLIGAGAWGMRGLRVSTLATISFFMGTFLMVMAEWLSYKAKKAADRQGETPSVAKSVRPPLSQADVNPPARDSTKPRTP